MFIQRHLAKVIPTFKDKIVFISGPRQSGKTSLIEHACQPDLILNMDIAQDRLTFKRFPESIIDWYQTAIGPFPSKPQISKPLVFIDEIQKVKGWRSLMKGSYDKTRHAIRYIASGSSAFELRRQNSGDSLAGRAIWLHLYPITFREYVETMQPDLPLPKPWTGQGSLVERCRALGPHQKELRSLWDIYAKFGSFPDPLVEKNTTFSSQWLKDYLSAMLDRDLRDLQSGKDAERVYRVFELLLEGLGSTYSLRSIAETLGVSPNTIKSDIRALHHILWGIELSSSQVSIAKQIRKEKKFYPIDFSLTRYQTDLPSGSAFESTVACLLTRTLEDALSGPLNQLQLGFYRDYSGREIDFVLRDKKRVLLAIECKLKAKHPQHLNFFTSFKPMESILVVEEPGLFSATDGIFIVSIERLAAACL